ncbi:MAG: hypothetical protein OEY41_01695 [Acidimicrobiia bacterium]|nr:hypothetical protein [Acidimicrobiia bacterium]MDH4363317.1 hypothetical protein [Acidimicrobiia bacterium]MDH5288691.1 hypothetical protein [Acidimicrobiia bacterium]
MADDRSLTFLSWNLALLERSAEAPPAWDQAASEAAVRDQVLALAPDIVLLQELPGLVPYVETHDMIRANPRTHSGHLATLVTHELMATEPAHRVVPGCAVLTTFTGAGAGPALTVANVHLAAGPGAAATGERLAQLADVVEASPTEALLVVGDTNTREAEMVAVQAAGLVTVRPPRATWDSRRNRFRAGGAEFTAHFTRWIASPAVTVSEVTVWHQPVVVDGHRFHLSDHFALSGRVSLA